MGSGGFAYIYEAIYHGVKRAFKFIKLDRQTHEYNINSYGCHEYYFQENDKNLISFENNLFSSKWKTRANEKYGDLVDAPISYFFVESVSTISLKLILKTKNILVTVKSACFIN